MEGEAGVGGGGATGPALVGMISDPVECLAGGGLVGAGAPWGRGDAVGGGVISSGIGLFASRLLGSCDDVAKLLVVEASTTYEEAIDTLEAYDIVS
jgi:hypothetical protein